jgi:hypothetical protein
MKESEKGRKSKRKRREKLEHLCNCVVPGQSLKDDDNNAGTATKSLGEKTERNNFQSALEQLSAF